MADIFEIVGRIGLDGVDKAEKELKNFSGEGEKTSSKLSKLGGVAKAVGKGVLAVGSAAVTGSVALIKGVQGAYGELQQNLGGSEAVFGQYASNIQKIGEEAYKNMGMSQSQFLATANKMGSLLQGSGIDQQASLDMTTKAMQRASDVASVMGIDMQTAMESITGACKGNFTMMDNLGVAMNATNLEAYALEKGLTNFSWNTASQAEKNTLAMQMFLERTEQYAGNFARESTETITGAMGNLGSAWEDFMAGLGNPEADMARLTNNLAQSFGGMVKNTIPIIQNIANSLPTVMDSLIGAVSEMLPTLIETFTTLISQVIDGIVEMLPQFIPLFVDTLMTVAQALIENAPTLINAVILLVTEVINSLTEMLPTLIPLIVQVMVDITVALVENLPLIIGTLINMFPVIIESVLAGLSVLLENVGSWFGTLLNSIGTWFSGVIETGKQKSNDFVNGIVSFIKNLPEKIGYWLGYALGSIARWAVDIKNKAVESGTNFVNNFINFIKNLPQNLQILLTNTIARVTQFVSNLRTKAIQGARNFVTNMVNGLRSLPSKVISIGSDVVKGLWNGITNAGKWLKDKITGFASGIVSGFKDAFGIHSPSRVMATVGNFLTQGLGVGIEEDDSAERAVGEKVNSILGIANGSMAKIKVGTSVDGLIGENPMTKYQLDFNAQFSSLSDGFDRLIALVGEYLPNIAGGMDRQLVIDGSSLVVGVSRKMDSQLGRMAVAKGRGNV